jgi:hypothetical protein
LKPKIGIPPPNKEKYAKHLRLIIYSFLDFDELISKISRLRKIERRLLLASESKYLNQERKIILRFPGRKKIGKY